MVLGVPSLVCSKLLYCPDKLHSRPRLCHCKICFQNVISFCLGEGEHIKNQVPVDTLVDHHADGLFAQVEPFSKLCNIMFGPFSKGGVGFLLWLPRKQVQGSEAAGSGLEMGNGAIQHFWGKGVPARNFLLLKCWCFMFNKNDQKNPTGQLEPELERQLLASKILRNEL